MSAAIEIFNRLADRSEGGTIALNGMPVPSAGFLVGGAVQSLIFESVDHANHPDALTTIHGYLTLAETGFAGWWVDSDTGRVYVDHVDYVKSERGALNLARGRGELAVWDLGNEREIRVA